MNKQQFTNCKKMLKGEFNDILVPISVHEKIRAVREDMELNDIEGFKDNLDDLLDDIEERGMPVSENFYEFVIWYKNQDFED